jgi:hypothetical protein
MQFFKLTFQSIGVYAKLTLILALLITELAGLFAGVG